MRDVLSWLWLLGGTLPARCGMTKLTSLIQCYSGSLHILGTTESLQVHLRQQCTTVGLLRITSLFHDGICALHSSVIPTLIL